MKECIFQGEQDKCRWYKPKKEEPPEEQPEEPVEDTTPEPTDTTTEKPTETPSKEPEIKQFTDISEETCGLSNLNLNKSSYNLKIEISNAKLKTAQLSRRGM